MALFVTASIDFVNRPYRIPNQNESTDLSAWLTAKESEIMEDLLGIPTWDAFQAALLEDYPADKWEDLRDGANYTYGGYTWKWQGLNKMLIPILYAEWIKTPVYQKLSNIGIGINSKDDYTVINPAATIAQAQNAFARLAGAHYNYGNSLYGFMIANYEDDYTTWRPLVDWKDPGYMNLFDL